ncbi:hypothetical protein GGR50DRAFT_690367 [Xylaria sp. CBS 124048]|nr:hypothetical protein GGR50DRAFT_690367 [Xylaria sp. CBS 124048]
MATENQELTHDEIWDDSALINSWDEALKEYNTYHSIHKNGGNVNDLLKPKPEESEDARRSLSEVPAAPRGEEPETILESREDNEVHGQRAGDTANRSNHPRMEPLPSPLGVLSTMRDESLKQLLMAWYYAGYYTGVYEARGETPQSRERTE